MTDTAPSWLPVPDAPPAVPRIALTLDEAGDACGVSGRTIFSWIKSGRLPSIKIGKSHRVMVDDLKTFLAAQRA